MTEPCVDPSANRPRSVREELEALQRAAAERRWRDFVRALPTETEGYRRAAEAVEVCWHDLSEDDQALILHVKESCERIIESPPQPNLVERIMAHVSGSSDEEKRQIRR